MKFIATIATSFIFMSAFASAKKNPQASTEKSRFVYLEFYPNSDKSMTIQSIKCDSETNDLRTQTWFRSLSR